MNNKGKKTSIDQAQSTSSRKRLLYTSLDFSLLIPILFLMGIGCFFIYNFTALSTVEQDSEYYFIRQVIFALFGTAVMLITSKIDYHRITIFVIPSLLCVVLFNIRILIPDFYEQIHDIGSYFYIGHISVHWGYLAESMACLVLARLMTRKMYSVKFFFFVGIFIILAESALLSVYDLSGAIVIFLTALIVLFIAHSTTLLLPSALYGLLFGGVLSLYFKRRYVGDYINRRILGWLDPFSDSTGIGYEPIQSMYAIADGGLLGKGFGNGTMLYTVNNAHKESILAAIIQEIGIAGIAMILLLFLAFLFRAHTISNRASDRWGFYLAATITTRFCVVFVLCLLQIVNMLPRTESMLFPFLSFGGNELMLDCASVGLLLSIARSEKEFWRE